MSVNGQPLPYRTGTPQSFSDLLADTLVLRSSAGSEWRTRIRDSTTTPNACCNHTFTSSVDVAWQADGDSLTITTIFPAGSVDHRARIVDDSLRIQLTRGGFLPDGAYVYGR